MEELSIPIVQQPRLTLVLPVAVVAAAVLGGSLVWYLARAAGAPRAAGGVVAAVFLLGGIGLAVSTGLGSQGTVRVDRSGGLTVDARFRGERRVPLTGAVVERWVWIRGGPPGMVVGVAVRVSGGGESVSIGVADPGLAAEYHEAGIESSTSTPSVRVDGPDFRRLVERLPGPGPAGGAA